MDTKKIIEYGLIAIAAYIALRWLLSIASSVGSGFAGAFTSTPSYVPTVFAPGIIYQSADIYGGTTVRWGQGGSKGGYTGRPRRSGGY